MTSNDQFPDEASPRIAFLMQRYHWGRFEAQCYFFYEQYDENDWIDYE